MRIGLIAPPFISVPPVRYGGTELFVAHLARGLYERGHDVTVYANGESYVPCRLKWRYPKQEWPIKDFLGAQLRCLDHTAWALQEASRDADIIHLNDVSGVPMVRFTGRPAIVTLHHPHEPVLTDLYEKYPEIQYVAISQWQAAREPMPKLDCVPHGVPLDDYTFRRTKDDYVAFLGRMAPCKGAHLAIAAARRAGIRLKLAGEIQPTFQDYWDREVAPLIDGDQIVYVGEADLAQKNELLGRARALLFPIQWEEPFGLVMIEAMACGTPVLAFAGGSVAEIVADGTSGWICRDVADMADKIAAPPIPAASCRNWVAEHFSLDRVVDRYCDIYDEAITEQGASTTALGA